MSARSIFDLGLHKGKDSEFYLRKGFSVIGIEAVPALAAFAAEYLDEYLHDGRMTIIQKALSSSDGEVVPFYINPDKDDWGSLSRGHAEKGGKSTEILVETISLDTLFELYGIPHYIKCDLEGGDSIFVRELQRAAARPCFVSVEFNELADIEILAECGYDRFQIVNQWLNPFLRPPIPPREGSYADKQFDGETSGLFGMELPPEKWRPLSETLENLALWTKLRLADDNLAWGWVDVHCTSSAGES